MHICTYHNENIFVVRFRINIRLNPTPNDLKTHSTLKRYLFRLSNSLAQTLNMNHEDKATRALN